MKAPFPYFGAKSKVAAKVWRALGQPKHYIEPFFGSGAVLLARPDYEGRIETICDKDGFVCNVWRSLKFKPDEVAEWCDWPVNHADLNARRKRLIAEEKTLLEQLANDDMYCNPKLAGYWIWAAGCWIGSGLTRPDSMPRVDATGRGVHSEATRRRPTVSTSGNGVHAIGKRPQLANTGIGVHKMNKRGVCNIGQIPEISTCGSGVHKMGKRSDSSIGKIPHVIDMGKGVHAKNANIYQWFRELSARLRNVRSVCGDWKRVCGGNWQDGIGTVGMFFDPPYGVTDRDTDIYHHDSTDVAGEVREWCLARGEGKLYRIVLAGYYEEHESLLDHGWTVERWKANGGYGNRSDGQGKKNSNREALFFSPHCVGQNTTLF